MDLMIDIETLGVKTNAPVISIGACFFNDIGVLETFYIELDIVEQIDSGKRFADASTIKWWMNQKGAAKKIFRDDAVDVREGLELFHSWMIEFGFCEVLNRTNIKPWGNGSNFDITILESLFKDYGIEIPWDFRNIRDLRTFKEYVYDGKDVVRTGTHHNALDDALYQAQIVVDGLSKKRLLEEYKI